MKTKTVHQRQWCRYGWVTDTGILLDPSHVVAVCKEEKFKAALATTGIIKRIMAA